MPIRYTLSWEEFLEVYESSFPRPSVASFVACLFVATCVGCFGAALTYAVDQQDKLTASTFLWVSAALFALSLADFRTRTKFRRKRAEKDLRQTYDRYLGADQTFSFDEQKCAHEMNGTKRESTWGTLMIAVELRQTIYLVTKAGQLTFRSVRSTVKRFRSSVQGCSEHDKTSCQGE